MKSRVECYIDRRWKPLAIFESTREAILLLPAIGRKLHSTVRLITDGQSLPDVEGEPIPRGVFADNKTSCWTFQPELE